MPTTLALVISSSVNRVDARSTSTVRRSGVGRVLSAFDGSIRIHRQQKMRGSGRRYGRSVLTGALYRCRYCAAAGDRAFPLGRRGIEESDRYERFGSDRGRDLAPSPQTTFPSRPATVERSHHIADWSETTRSLQLGQRESRPAHLMRCRRPMPWLRQSMHVADSATESSDCGDPARCGYANSQSLTGGGHSAIRHARSPEVAVLQFRFATRRRPFLGTFDPTESQETLGSGSPTADEWVRLNAVGLVSSRTRNFGCQRRDPEAVRIQRRIRDRHHDPVDTDGRWWARRLTIGFALWVSRWCASF